MPLEINGYNETFKAFVDFAQAKRHGIADLVAEDNAAALDIDGIIVTLVASGDAVSISADIGEPPAEGRASFADLLLEANLQADALCSEQPLGARASCPRRARGSATCPSEARLPAALRGLGISTHEDA